jgi:hypothetical protein
VFALHTARETTMTQQKPASRDDLKAREYRDENGQIHHHTRPYMERHRGEGGGEGEKRGRASPSKGASAARGGRGGKVEHPIRARTATDHDEIRTWTEEHGGRPAAVKRTHRGGDVGIIRIMFPDAPNSEHDALEEISWEEFFQEFDKRELALLYDEEGSLFTKIIGRDTAEKRARGDHDAAR